MTVLVTVAFGCAFAFGEDRESNAAALSSLLERPKSVQAPDATYRDYFAGRDDFIEAEFQKRWQISDNRTAAKRAADASLTPVQSVAEFEAQRREFAMMVVRVRLESALNQYLASRERTSSLRKAHQTLNSFKNQSVKVAPAPGEKSSPWEFQFGYNFFTDYSRFEVVKGGFRFGVHHSALLGDLTGPSDYGPRLNVSTSLGLNAPVLWAGYTLGDSSFQTGLTKQFAPTLSGQFYTYQPTATGGSESYGVQLNYTF